MVLDEKKGVLFFNLRRQLTCNVKRVWLDFVMTSKAQALMRSEQTRARDMYSRYMGPRPSLVVPESPMDETTTNGKEFTLETFWEYLFSEEWHDKTSLRVRKGSVLSFLLDSLEDLLASGHVVCHETLAYVKQTRKVSATFKSEASKSKTVDEVVLLEFFHFGLKTEVDYDVSGTSIGPDSETTFGADSYETTLDECSSELLAKSLHSGDSVVVSLPRIEGPEAQPAGVGQETPSTDHLEPKSTRKKTSLMVARSGGSRASVGFNLEIQIQAPPGDEGGTEGPSEAASVISVVAEEKLAEPVKLSGRKSVSPTQKFHGAPSIKVHEGGGLEAGRTTMRKSMLPSHKNSSLMHSVVAAEESGEHGKHLGRKSAPPSHRPSALPAIRFPEQDEGADGSKTAEGKSEEGSSGEKKSKKMSSESTTLHLPDEAESVADGEAHEDSQSKLGADGKSASFLHVKKKGHSPRPSAAKDMALKHRKSMKVHKDMALDLEEDDPHHKRGFRGHGSKGDSMSHGRIEAKRGTEGHLDHLTKSASSTMLCLDDCESDYVDTEVEGPSLEDTPGHGSPEPKAPLRKPAPPRHGKARHGHGDKGSKGRGALLTFSLLDRRKKDMHIFEPSDTLRMAVETRSEPDLPADIPPWPQSRGTPSTMKDPDDVSDEFAPVVVSKGVRGKREAYDCPLPALRNWSERTMKSSSNDIADLPCMEGGTLAGIGSGMIKENGQIMTVEEKLQANLAKRLRKRAQEQRKSPKEQMMEDPSYIYAPENVQLHHYSRMNYFSNIEKYLQFMRRRRLLRHDLTEYWRMTGIDKETGKKIVPPQPGKGDKQQQQQQQQQLLQQQQQQQQQEQQQRQQQQYEEQQQQLRQVQQQQQQQQQRRGEAGAAGAKTSSPSSAKGTANAMELTEEQEAAKRETAFKIKQEEASKKRLEGEGKERFVQEVCGVVDNKNIRLQLLECLKRHLHGVSVGLVMLQGRWGQGSPGGAALEEVVIPARPLCEVQRKPAPPAASPEDSGEEEEKAREEPGTLGGAVSAAAEAPPMESPPAQSPSDTQTPPKKHKHPPKAPDADQEWENDLDAKTDDMRPDLENTKADELRAILQLRRSRLGKKGMKTKSTTGKKKPTESAENPTDVAVERPDRTTGLNWSFHRNRPKVETSNYKERRNEFRTLHRPSDEASEGVPFVDLKQLLTGNKFLPPRQESVVEYLPTFHTETLNRSYSDDRLLMFDGRDSDPSKNFIDFSCRFLLVLGAAEKFRRRPLIVRRYQANLATPPEPHPEVPEAKHGMFVDALMQKYVEKHGIPRALKRHPFPETVQRHASHSGHGKGRKSTHKPSETPDGHHGSLPQHLVQPSELVNESTSQLLHGTKHGVNTLLLNTLWGMAHIESQEDLHRQGKFKNFDFLRRLFKPTPGYKFIHPEFSTRNNLELYRDMLLKALRTFVVRKERITSSISYNTKTTVTFTRKDVFAMF